jgi:TRAP-type mannitol/chloroaromatic compound transport system permease small subunit
MIWGIPRSKGGNMSRKAFWLVLCVVFSVATLAVCSRLFSAKTPTMPTNEDWHLVVIGESSMWLIGQAYADQIEKDVGVKVVDEVFPGLMLYPHPFTCH